MFGLAKDATGASNVNISLPVPDMASTVSDINPAIAVDFKASHCIDVVDAQKAEPQVPPDKDAVTV